MKIEVGNQYCFDTQGHDSYWKQYDGRTCTIIRPLTVEEADIDDVGPMWRIRLDGIEEKETDAFEDELFELE